MKCPLCSTQDLARVELGERDPLGAMRCPTCRGCWVSAGELERIEAGAWHSVEDLRLRAVEAIAERACPQCESLLGTVSPEDHPELRIERCPACHGFWLDSGELDGLHALAAEHAAEHGGLHSRPDGWSRLRWITYRVAERWQRSHEE